MKWKHNSAFRTDIAVIGEKLYRQKEGQVQEAFLLCPFLLEWEREKKREKDLYTDNIEGVKLEIFLQTQWDPAIHIGFGNNFSDIFGK